MKRSSLCIIACLISFFSPAQWTVINSGTTRQLRDVVSISMTIGFAVGSTTINASDGILLKTNDGGLTWDSIDYGANSNLFGISFPGNQVGFICGEGIILKTTDQGSTWDTAWYSDDLDYLKQVKFVNENVGYVLDHDYYKFLKTTDGGQTWTELEYPFEEVYQFNFSSPDTGFAAANDGSYGVWKTVDGGSTWTLSLEGSSYSNIYSCVSHISNQKWCALRDFDGQHAVLTADDGQNWTDSLMSNLDVDAFTPPFTALTFPDSTEGWAAGTKFIIHSSDGGFSWKVNDSSQYSIHGLHFYSPHLGFAVGDHGLIMRFDDAIQTSAPSTQELSDFQIFPNPAFDLITIQFSLENHSPMTLDLMDLQGRKIKTIAEGNFEAGNHQINFSGKDLPKGVYLLQLSTGIPFSKGGLQPGKTNSEIHSIKVVIE